VVNWCFFRNKVPLHDDENFLVFGEDVNSDTLLEEILGKFPQTKEYSFSRHCGCLQNYPKNGQKWYLFKESKQRPIVFFGKPETDQISFEIIGNNVFGILILADNLESAKQLFRSFVHPLGDTYMAYGGQFPEMKPTVMIHNVQL
jgi:hypothetical protein